MALVHKLNSKGQSLLEITITIGLSVLVVTALATVTIKGLSTSQTARLQTEASKYAQEGIDDVRWARDNTGTVCIDSTHYQWDAKFWSDGECNTGSCNFEIKTDGSSCGAAPMGYVTTNPYLDLITSGPTFKPISGTVFSREISINAATPSCTYQRQVTSTVKWTDSAGTHQSQVITVLADLSGPSC